MGCLAGGGTDVAAPETDNTEAAGLPRLLEENRKLMAISISILTLVAIYATAYLYYTYYHVSSPLIDAIVDWWYVVLIVILIILLVWLWPKVLPKKSQGTVVFH